MSSRLLVSAPPADPPRLSRIASTPSCAQQWKPAPTVDGTTTSEITRKALRRFRHFSVNP